MWFLSLGKECPSCVLYCCEEHHDQKQPGEEKVYFSLQLTVHHEGKRGQELKQELKQVPRRNTVCAFSACFLNIT